VFRVKILGQRGRDLRYLFSMAGLDQRGVGVRAVGQLAVSKGMLLGAEGGDGRADQLFAVFDDSLQFADLFLWIERDFLLGTESCQCSNLTKFRDLRNVFFFVQRTHLKLFGYLFELLMTLL